jgi:hypothetical protein
MSDQPNDLGESIGRKAPSWGEMRANLNHFDKAYEYLNSAPFNGDPEVVKAMIQAADIHARIGLGDKLEELRETLKQTVAQAIESNAELSQTVKKATNSVIIELRKATVREAA